MARLTESWLLFWLSWERDLSLLLLELILEAPLLFRVTLESAAIY